VLLVPLASLAFAGDVRPRAMHSGFSAVRRTGSGLLVSHDRGEPGAVERLLVLLALVVGEAVIAVDATGTGNRQAAALAGRRRLPPACRVRVAGSALPSYCADRFRLVSG